MIVLCVSVLAAIGLYSGAMALAGPEVDPVNGCPAGDRSPQAHTLVLIDETDSLTPRDLRFARALIRTEYLWLPMGGRLTVRNITADPDAAGEFMVCRMDDGSGVLGLFKNKKKAKLAFDRIAGAKLTDLSESLANAQPQDASPIIEAISGAADRADFGSGVPQRRLVVLSDFAQHSLLFSQYRGESPDEASREELADLLSGVEVRLQYVRRRGLAHIQSPDHRAFWEEQLEDMGAEVELGHDLHLGEDRTREIWTDDPL